MVELAMQNVLGEQVGSVHLGTDFSYGGRTSGPWD